MAEKKKSKWIKKATEGAHGQFRAKAEKAGESTRAYAEEHKGDSGKTGAQARLALNLMEAGKHRRKKLYDHPRSGNKE
jgi:hypothetical protein